MNQARTPEDKEFICEDDGAQCGLGGYCSACPLLDEAYLGCAETLQELGNPKFPKIKAALQPKEDK